MKLASREILYQKGFVDSEHEALTPVENKKRSAKSQGQTDGRACYL